LFVGFDLNKKRAPGQAEWEWEWNLKVEMKRKKTMAKRPALPFRPIPFFFSLFCFVLPYATLIFS
jgi:hypothetical protein